MKRILCAAIHFTDGELWKNQPKNIQTGFVICGHRHHNCLGTLYGIFKEDVALKKQFYIQGFLTSDNEFVDRKDAAKIAYDAGQIKTEVDLLFSEDLY